MTVQHTVQGAGAPTTAPPSLNAHYLDTTSKTSYVAVGTASAADWKPTATKDDVQTVADALAGKVDAVPGKALSTEDYSAEDKAKLAALEGSHYRGTYLSLAALQAAVAVGVPGDYADVDAGPGDEVTRFVWDADNSAWIDQKSAATPLTAAQVKALYESNADTNAFTDADKAKLTALEPGGGGGGAMVGDVLITARTPDASFIECNGSIQSQAAYPALFATVGLLGGDPSDGATWVGVNTITSGDSAVKVVGDGAGRWMASGQSGRASFSADNGATWADQVLNATDYMDTGAAYYGGTWYMLVPGRNEALRISTDNWASWITKPIADFTYSSFDAIAAGAGGVLVHVGGGLLITRDNGDTWEYLNAGGLSTRMRALAYSEGTWLAGLDGGSVERSTDDWVTHSTRPTGAPAEFRYRAIVKIGSRWVMTGAKPGSSLPTVAPVPAICYSDDDGLTWTSATVPATIKEPESLVAVTDTLLVGSSPQGWFRSMDAGITWETFTPTGLNAQEYCYYLGSDGVSAIGTSSEGGSRVLVSSGTSPTYDTAINFKLPELVSPAGLKSYIKAQ